MNFDPSEEHMSLRSSIERFVAEQYGSEQRGLYREWSLPARRKRWKELADLGVVSLPFPIEFGGLGGTAAELSIVMETFGAALIPEPYVSSVLMAGSIVDALGVERQRRDVLGPLIAGDSWLALAHSEPGTRFSLTHLSTFARRESTAFTLNGSKTCVIDGADADMFVVIARTAGACNERNGISAFLVSADTPGVRKQTYALADQTSACLLELTDVVVPSESLLGEEGGAFPALESMVCRTSIALCSEAVGIATAVIELTLEYLRSREQFGVALSSFQAIQHRMADCYVDLELARSLTLKATLIDPIADSLNWQRCAHAAKAFVSRVSIKIAEEAVQFHGAMGVTDALIVGHYLKRLLVVGTLFGDSHAQLAQFQLANVLRTQPWN